MYPAEVDINLASPEPKICNESSQALGDHLLGMTVHEYMIVNL